MKPSFNFEKQFAELGYKCIAGVDEVGRGCLAGPIVAGAVVFENYAKITPKIREIADSKILIAKKREELAEYIKKKAQYGIGEVSVGEIDRIGIGAANVLAFKRALDRIEGCDFALIDGRRFRGFDRKYFCLEKGESHSFSIAAASIIAKVYRDKMMADLSPDYPEYNFASNKGYSSKEHYEMLFKIGPSQIHRKSFLSFLDVPNKLDI